MSSCWYDIGYTNDQLLKMCKTEGSSYLAWYRKLRGKEVKSGKRWSSYVTFEIIILEPQSLSRFTVTSATVYLAFFHFKMFGRSHLSSKYCQSCDQNGDRSCRLGCHFGWRVRTARADFVQCKCLVKSEQVLYYVWCVSAFHFAYDAIFHLMAGYGSVILT